MDLISLSNNENSRGCSPRVSAAIAAAGQDPSHYPRRGDDRLQAALARHHGVAEDSIFCGPGCWALLQSLARAILRPGDVAVMSEFSFRGFAIVTEQSHGVVRRAGEAADGPDLGQMLRSAEGAKLVFLANPDNPSGKLFARGDVLRLVERLAPDTIVVVDEAYIEYAGDGAAESVLHDVGDHPNLIVLRSFSKVYGLAGVRLGWGSARPDLAKRILAAQTPHHLSGQAVAAGLAAIADQDFVAQCVTDNSIAREALRSALQAAGLPTHASWANFLMVDARSVPDAAARLLEQGVEVRDLELYGRPGWIRVTIGLDAENVAFLAALRKVLG